MAPYSNEYPIEVIKHVRLYQREGAKTPIIKTSFILKIKFQLVCYLLSCLSLNYRLRSTSLVKPKIKIIFHDFMVRLNSISLSRIEFIWHFWYAQNCTQRQNARVEEKNRILCHRYEGSAFAATITYFVTSLIAFEDCYVTHLLEWLFWLFTMLNME